MLGNYDPTGIIVCLDSPPYFRSDIYPEYKKLRKKNKDPEREKAIGQNRKLVMELLALLSIKTWGEEGMEADDLIAAACDEYNEDYDRIVIGSNDDDLYQLFKYDNVYFRSAKGNKDSGLFSLEDFYRENPTMTLRKWMRLLMIAGTHNDVAGIRGYGKKKAMDILDGGKYREFYKEYEEELDLFNALIDLPYHDDLEPPNLIRLGFSERRLMTFLATNGIEYTGYMKNAFKNLNGE
jgi:5'-3' exonuclease